MAGITANGFTRERLPELKTKLEEAMRSQFGDINTSPESLVGEIISIWSESQALLWEMAEDVYASQYPSSASGVNLDRVVGLNGIIRLKSTPTNVRCVVYGDAGTVLPTTARVKNPLTGDTFLIAESVTLAASSAVSLSVSIATVSASTAYTITIGGVAHTYTSDSSPTAGEIVAGLQSALAGITTSEDDGVIVITLGTVAACSVSANLAITRVGNYARFNCEVDGYKLAPAGNITEIVTPVSGWSAVVNLEDALPGRASETDSELRIRRSESIRVRSQNSIEAIYSAIKGLDDVTDCVVLENETNSTDVNGIPAHNIWAIVDGGADADIASAIFKNKPAGIGTKGSETEIYLSDVTKQEYTVKFSRPTPSPLYIKVDITTSAAFPGDGATQIINALVAFGESLKIGDDLAFTRLYSPINSVPGHYVTDLKVGLTNPPTGTTNVTCAADHRLTIAGARITINVV
jgi:uncharacterized phage protein gp47/JayE